MTGFHESHVQGPSEHGDTYCGACYAYLGSQIAVLPCKKRKDDVVGKDVYMFSGTGVSDAELPIKGSVRCQFISQSGDTLYVIETEPNRFHFCERHEFEKRGFC